MCCSSSEVQLLSLISICRIFVPVLEYVSDRSRLPTVVLYISTEMEMCPFTKHFQMSFYISTVRVSLDSPFVPINSDMCFGIHRRLSAYTFTYFGILTDSQIQAWPHHCSTNY